MTVYSYITDNKVRSFLIIALFVGFISAVAYVLGRVSSNSGFWFFLALIISGCFSFASFFWGDRFILFTVNAQPAQRKKDFNFYTVAENLAIASGLPMPKLYIIENNAPNAFATGRDPKHAIICVTRGLLEKLDRRELEGVIAHEISHIKNFDTRLMVIVSVLVGTIAYVSDWFLRSLWWRRSWNDERKGGNAVFLILGIMAASISPIVATLIQFALSRRREFLADADGALLTRYPDGLANALEKISQDKALLPGASNATAHLFIVNPLKGRDVKDWLNGLFNTHPPIEERIRILRSM